MKNQYLVYFWMWEDEDAVKIGHSNISTYHNSIITKRPRYSHKTPIDLGFILFDEKAEALNLEKALHSRFKTIKGTEWVPLTTDLELFIEENCTSIPEDDFKHHRSKRGNRRHGMRAKDIQQKRLAIALMFSGMSQKDVAEYFEVSHNCVNEWCQTTDFEMVRAEMLEFVFKQFDLEKLPIDTGE